MYHQRQPLGVYIQTESCLFQEYVDKNKAEQSSFKDLIKSEANRRSVFISVSLMLVHQLSGISVVLFYLESIFKATESTISSSLSAIMAGAAMFIVALISPPVLKKYGYIKPLTFSATGSGISLVGTALCDYVENLHFCIQ